MYHQRGRGVLHHFGNHLQNFVFIPGQVVFAFVNLFP